MNIINTRLESLIPYARNPRKNDHAIDALAGAIKEFGFRVPILAKSDHTVIDGHLRIKAAQKLGLETVPVVICDDMTDTEIKAFRININRMAELAEWDMDLLKLEIDELGELDFDLDLLGFDELDSMFPEEPKKGLTDDDDVPEVEENIHGVKRGDIWKLGDHRLLCGDSTDKDDVDRLMNGEKADMVFTDPPYGVAVKNTQGSIEGDVDLKVFIASLPLLKEASVDDAHFYVWCASGDMLPESIWEFSKVFHFQNLLPVRCTHENKRGPKGAFKLNYESCLFGNDNKRKHLKTNIVGVSQTTLNDDRYNGDGSLSVYPALWDEQRSTEHNMNIVHPTQKKVSMIEFYIQISSSQSKPVLDLFLGSGSTLIACEKTNRKCYGMEIDPHYCSVIIERWQKFTGEKAVLLND